jgi:hypothetical protein
MAVKYLAAWRLAPCLWVAACTGSIGDLTTTSPSESGGAPAGQSSVQGHDDTTTGPLVAGRVTLHRLNRTEYNNTVRDLLGTKQTPGDDLPAEDLAFGFDNIADALNVSSLHVATYETAAERLIDEALADGALARSAILTCDAATGGASCARDIIGGFLRRAWRRPADGADLARLTAFVDLAKSQGDSALVGIKLALEAALVSPRFLYRVELDPAPVPDHAWPVDDYELASRLSYFLWSSMPDEQLLASADAHALSSGAVLRTQVERMLRDPRAHAITQNFAAQWLYTRAIPRHEPDRTLFPSYDATLGQSMATSMELFFDELLHKGRPIEDFVRGDFLEVDRRLAAHYGVAGPPASGFIRVDAPEPRRAGVLGQAGLLMVTSETGRTSPVKRGAWVLDNLLCSPPPPPPPGVTGLDRQTGMAATGTVRQRMERHRANPACAACHLGMDPIGFGLESFDAIGAYRSDDGGQPLDTKGTMPDGRSFQNAPELGAIIAADPRFAPCIAEKMATYALGRGLSDDDRPFVENVAAAAGNAGRSLAAYVQAIAASIPFRQRDPGPKGAP